MSPSSTADDTGGYGGFGVEGLAFPKGQHLSQCDTCASESTVTPHASFLALDVAPQQAYANIQKLRSLYPDVYTHDGGFYDAVNPSTGQVGHRRLVLDQSMIMAALDNALNAPPVAALVRDGPDRRRGTAGAAGRAHVAVTLEVTRPDGLLRRSHAVPSRPGCARRSRARYRRT